MNRKCYPSDLTDAQWAVLEPWNPPPRPGGRPWKIDMGEVVNAIFYLTREGCKVNLNLNERPPKPAHGTEESLAGKEPGGRPHKDRDDTEGVALVKGRRREGQKEQGGASASSNQTILIWKHSPPDG
jgi:hypothetical protein